MKLNKKGWSKAEKYLCPECWKDTNWERPNEPEFEQDDFQDTVTLTLEEAKKISDALEWVDGYMYSYAYKNVIEDFNKRIEQAQSGNVE